MTPHPGITERRDRDGRIRYHVRVRRGGAYQAATLPALEQALAWRAKALAAADGLGEPPEPPRRRRVPPPALTPTIEAACRRFAKAMLEGTARTRSGTRYKPSVIRTYEEALRLDVVPRVGGLPVSVLTRGDVQRLVDEIAAERSPRAAQKALTALRVVLHLCERYGELEQTPCVRIRVPLGDGHEERSARILTPEECERLIAAAEADDARLERSFAAPLVALAYATGARLGELLALAWGREGLDLDAGLLRVRRSLDRVRGDDGHHAIVATKTRHARRDIPLAREEVARLRRHRLASGRPPEGALVFSDAHGQPIGPGLPRAAWDRIVKATNLAEPLPRFHDLRHAAATHMLAAGLSAHAVAALLGHADAGLVWRRYGHALPEEVASSGETLAAWRRAQRRRIGAKARKAP